MATAPNVANDPGAVTVGGVAPPGSTSTADAGAIDVHEVVAPTPPVVPPPVPGREKTPAKGTLARVVLLEYTVYVIVALLLVIALWVNVWAAYFNGGAALVNRFSADANFLLAAAAVLVIAFELRKERRELTKS